MLPFSSTVSGQIGFLIDSLNDSNYDSVLRELCQFVEYGINGSILLLQTCFVQISIHEEDLQSMQLKSNLLSAIFRYLLDKPNFSTVLCESLRSSMMSEGFLGDLSKALKLSAPEKIGIGLALSDSEDLDFRTRGQNFCVAQIEEMSANPSPVVSQDQIQNILMFLYHSDGLSKHVDTFIQMLFLLQQKEKAPFVLAPMLMNDFCENPLRNLDSYVDCDEHDFDSMLAEMEKEMSMADVMKELGYGCTVNGLQCKEILSLFLPLNEITISRIISTIVRTRMGLDDSQSTYATFCSALGCSSCADSSWLSSWNVDVLLDSIKQLAPETNWILVMENLDHEGFYLPDEESFSLFMAIYAAACKDPFPLHAICGSIWSNADGQLSFLKYAVPAPPEKFTFAHSARQLSFMEPVHGNKPPYGGANQAWTCLDLLEVLCKLAEKGHSSSVRTLLEYPLKHCPEALLIGIAHINTSFNFLQYEVSSTVFPTIVGNGTAMKSGTIHQLWHVKPNLVVRGFIDITNVDLDNISRILDICIDVKILLAVLDMAPFSFSIKLAALASRKEHLNLENWLNENLSTYKDAFFEDCLRFLKEILFDPASDVPTNPFQHSGAIGNVIPETSSTFFQVLHAHSGLLVSQQLAEEMKRLHATTIHVNPRLQSAGAIDSSTSDGFPDDIETAANSYFHQIFSGEMTMDAMIQMLAHFKGSCDKREQDIFGCMIRNLFDEYKFFHRYPEKQLKITAVLFGSLIKHQLVSHLALGCALRGVLDALRKSVDSKMFLFGSKALEQFTERLVEWPQYCNHILQISHLRGTHADLVAFIERALARISSSQSEPNGGRSAPTDQHQSSTAQVTLENTEASEASWQLMGSGGTPSGQQLSSPLQLQHRNQGLLDDRHRASTTSVGYLKPLLNPSGQSSLVAAHFDLVANQKSNGVQSLQTVSSQQPSSGSGPKYIPAFLRPSRALTSGGFGAALNIETLVAAAERRDTPIEAPASEIQDKILFMINNISAANMDAKAKEFTDVFKEQYYPWFAQYMVMKRASIEPNFHDLYLKFLDKVNSRALNKEIVKATYENCKVLLGSELIKSSSEERSLLKNLGSWLGKFTIGRNQALRAREIDPKVLIIEAYEKGLMIAVIPFTSKILEPCQCSLAYQPPNPWTMGILSLLAEIYALPNLKMNLKFDIEVLFKNLGVDMKDVKPTSLLKDRVREIEGNPDFSNKDLGVSHQQMVADLNPGMVCSLNQVELQPEVVNPSLPGGHSSVINQYTAPLHLVSSALAEDDKMGSLSLSERLSSGQGLSQVAPSQSPFSISQLSTPLPSIGSHVVVNQKLNALGLHLQFQRILPMAMERAIREVIAPVVERSVTIACMTTKELVLKDYVMESDESRIHNAANLMVASLAANLAHVTCKELLRLAMTNHLRSLLQALNVTSEYLEQAILLVTNDNLDLGCAAVEQPATEKALQNIDEVIAHMLSIRRKQREGLSSAFYDASTYAQGTLARLPEALRPKPGRLSIAQQRVYEDFVRFPWQNQTSQQISNTMPAVPSGGSSLSRVYGSSIGQLNSSMYSTAQIAAGFGNAVQPLDQMSEEMDPGSTQPLSVSSSHVGAADDGVVQHGAESVIPSFTSTVAGTEVHTTESPPSVKESGSIVQPSLSTSVTERVGTNIIEPLLSTGDALEKYQIVAQKLETLISKDARDAEIQVVIAEVPEIILRCVSRDEAALAIAQKVFKSLYENASNGMHVGSHLAILAAIRDVCKLVVKELTSWVIYSDEERKFNKDITVGLIRSDLLNLAEYNVHLAKLIDAGRNKAATEFAISLVKTLLGQEPGVSVTELYNLIEALTKLAMRPGSPESLQQLVETARNPSSNVASQSGFVVGKEDKARQVRDKKVTSGRAVTGRDDGLTSADSGTAEAAASRDQASLLLAEWLQICEYNGTNDTVFAPYIAHLQQSGMLKGDDLMDRFFRLLTELAVSRCLASSEAPSASLSLQTPHQVQNLSFHAIDMYARLILLVVKYCGVDQGSNKVSLLPKILLVTVRVIQKDTEEKKASFNPRPYFRLFVNWLIDFCSPDPSPDATNFQILTAFANAFHALQPLKVPGFSFAWLELVSHRSFMPKLLVINSQKGWPFVQRLLVDLFKFMEPYLRNAELGEPVHFLYKGTLRVLLVLLHDFPEFLCDYHFSFCDVIPPSCIQMRNVILSAFPRNMRLPDPFTPNLKVDLLPEISHSPRILSEVDGALKAKQMKADIDEYLKTRQPGSAFLLDLKQRLLLPQAEAALTGTRYNVPLINSLVLYVGMQAIQQLQSKSTPQQLAVPTPPMTHSAPMDIFQKLIIDLDTEGRYLFLNAVANQLRYPNNHTHYFSCVLLFLFAEANQDIIQEQITRVLLERLIVNRPHPWGLLITFIELIKNPRYSFWSRSFTRCAPEIEKLFESVARSCGGPGMKVTEDGDGTH